MGRRNVLLPSREIALSGAAVKMRDLLVALLCIAPPLYVSHRLPTLHTITDNKWLVVVFLSACGVFLAALSWTAGRRKPRTAVSPLILALILGATAFALAHVLSALLSREPVFSLQGASPSLSLIVLFGTVVWQPPRPESIRKFAILLLATGSLIGACAIAQHLGIDPLAAVVRYREPERYRGVFVTLGNPEYLGGYLAPLALVAVGLCFSCKNRWARGAAFGAALLTAVPAFLSGSRGAFLGMLSGALVLLIGSVTTVSVLSRRFRVGGLAVCGAIVALLAILLFARPHGRPIGLMGVRFADLVNPHTDSIRARIVFDLVAMEMIAGHPLFGVGPGMFGVEFYPTFLRLGQSGDVTLDVLARDFKGTVAEHAHNDWLEIWAETGLAGFAAWLWVLAASAAAVIRSLLRRSENVQGRFLVLGLFSAVIALLVNALFNFPLHEPVRATVFWLALSWCVSLARSTETGPKPN